MSNTILRTDSLTLDNLANTTYLSADNVYINNALRVKGTENNNTWGPGGSGQVAIKSPNNTPLITFHANSGVRMGSIGWNNSVGVSALEIKTLTSGDIILDGAGNILLKDPTTVGNISASDELIIPVGNISERPAQITGSIRFNTETVSFEGWNGLVWAGMGGLNHLDSGGGIDGSRRASIGGPNPPSICDTHDVWYDISTRTIKYYDGSNWNIFGAAYQ